MMKKGIKSTLLATFLAILVVVPTHAVDDSKNEAERQPVRVAAVQKRSLQQREEFRLRVQARRAEIRQDICERRQAKLEGAITRLSKRSTVLKERIDRMYDRVVGFYEKGQLTVEGYDGYIEKIETAKVAATDSIDLVNDQTFTLDCTTSAVGQQLDGFRLAIQDARTPLKEYRKALVELISAMRAEAAVSNLKDKDTRDVQDGADAARTEENNE